MKHVHGKVPAIILLLGFLLLLGSACSRQDESAKGFFREPKDDSPVVARVGGGAVTVADLKSYLSDKSNANLQRVSKEQWEQSLDARVLEEVLYQEALRLELDQNPEMRRNIRQMLTSRLMDDYMKREVWSKEVDEAELQAYYDEHWSEFNRPEQLRIADIFIAVPENVTNTKTAELREKAETVLNRAIEQKTKRFGFGALVQEYSDAPENYRKGDTGFFDDRGHPAGLDKALVDAAFALERVGSMSEDVIETSDGFHIIMLTGKRSGVNILLENVRQKLTQRIRREKAAQARKAFIEGLKEKAHIEVDDKVLAGLLAELKAQAQTSRPVSPGARAPASQGNLNPPPLPQGQRE
jgi:peptidyl-prolyl cis-trans isomerase C